MIRTFMAVEVSATLRAQLAALQDVLREQLGLERYKDVRIAWVQPPSIHMTIKFLGDTDENQLAPLHDAMEHAVTPHLPLRIPLERIGVFPRVQQPTVLWVGPSEGWRHTEDASRLVALHQAVEAACQPFGFPPEGRTLSPHLTVARIKEGQRRVGQALRRSGVMDRLEVLDALPVRTIAMMKSELRPTGSLYTRVWDC